MLKIKFLELSKIKKSILLVSFIQENWTGPCTSNVISKTTTCWICLDDFKIDEKIVTLTWSDTLKIKIYIVNFLF